MSDTNNFESELREVLMEIQQMLLAKNRKYGDSALNPKRIFSKADVVEQIKVRIDDKLSRIANKQSDDDEDAETDLLGYLIFLKIAQKRKAKHSKMPVDALKNQGDNFLNIIRGAGAGSAIPGFGGYYYKGRKDAI